MHWKRATGANADPPVFTRSPGVTTDTTGSAGRKGHKMSVIIVQTAQQSQDSV